MPDMWVVIPAFQPNDALHAEHIKGNLRWLTIKNWVPRGDLTVHNAHNNSNTTVKFYGANVYSFKLEW